MKPVDLLIVGAGPAGMTAAIVARSHGLEVTVLDDQPAPGGQVWRSVELTPRRDAILGDAYTDGREVVEHFRACGATYLSDAQLWQVEAGFRAFITREDHVEVIECRALILATGAQERPTPFPGWTLPGVITVGAAQILLKNAGQVPVGPVWIAGSGPLPLLYAVQLLRAGGQLAGYLDTTPDGQWRDALRFLPGALRASADLLKGIRWTRTVKQAGRFVSGVTDLEALGRDRVETIRYRTHDDDGFTTVKASALLVHEGVVPNIHASLALDCEAQWNSSQDCYVPVLDDWGESSQANLFIAGDSAGIAGAKSAQLRGALAALRVAVKLGSMSESAAAIEGRPIRRKLQHELAVRPFLDALFKPRPQVFAPTDDTIVCRCEEITAGEIRALAVVGLPGPNQIKAACRAGMGPCQGRQCGYTVMRILCAVQNRTPNDVGFFHIRPPLKPLTLGEMACLDSSVSPGAESQAEAY